MKVTVRLLRREDRDAWERLWSGYHAYGRSGDTDPPKAVTQATWERLSDRAQPMAALVAEREGRPVGFVHLVFYPSTHATEPACFLNDLFVEEGLRGRGIGRALIEAAYAHAAAAGARRIHWHVNESNRLALRFYDKVAGPSGHVVYHKEL